MPAVTTVAPGFFGSGGGGVGSSGVLGEVGGTRVLYLGRVDDVLSVVGELNVSLRASPLAVARGVSRAVSESTGVAEGSDGAVRSVRGVSVSVGVRGDVSGLKVGHLGCVDHAAVVSERRGTVLDETCGKICGPLTEIKCHSDYLTESFNI